MTQYETLEYEVFSKRISVHDRYQFEMKLDYLFHPKKAFQRYTMEAFFFLPSNIGLNADNYQGSDFYCDIHKYIRFKTPVMSFEQLLDVNSTKSPLKKIEDTLHTILQKPDKKLESVFIYESKLLACIFRSTLRYYVMYIHDKLETILGTKSSELQEQELLMLAKELKTRCNEIMQRYRQLGLYLLSIGISDQIRKTHILIDEFISLSLEHHIYNVLVFIEKYPQTPQRDLFFAEFRDIVIPEQEYRKNKGYISVIDKRNEDQNLFLYRQGLLKRYSSNIFHLNIRHRDPSVKWHHILYGIAAGISMVFATVFGLLAQQWFQNYSASLLFSTVVLYIGKDRIKDLFREIFKKQSTHWSYDRESKIYSPTDKVKIGNCKEKFWYLRKNEIPEAVLELRNANIHEKSYLSLQEFEECVFCYKRAMKLYTAKINKLHHFVGGLNDIIRFNVHRMLYKLDEPKKIVPYVKKDSLHTIRCPQNKVYHLNVVFRFTIHDAESQIVKHERLRVILNQQGIQSVEKIL
ncbi:MAG: hypothetical protein KBC30_05410 [Planctomycetes bacterium]|nr:hypothetical protein [Planctomycetota bacterium]HPY74897.1 hypothetical protein [Planctomycetota bacterium]HQB00529.1 hypothetical protein [Planctomycetota bacterium]